MLSRSIISLFSNKTEHVFGLCHSCSPCHSESLLAEKHKAVLIWLVTGFVMSLLPGCKGIYYSTLQTFNVQKRDVVVTRVRQARDAEKKAQDRLVSAFDRFAAVVTFEGGELDDMYRSLKSGHRRSSSAARTFGRRVDAVENSGADMLKSWEKKLEKYEANSELWWAGSAQLSKTEMDLNELVGSMRRVEEEMGSVLNRLDGHIRFLKPNVNSVAASTLDEELETMRGLVETTVQDMERSIRKSQKFIDKMMKLY